MLLKISAGLSDLEDIRDYISSSATSIGVESSLIGDLKLAVDEAVSNIILYGYQGRSGEIEIDVSASHSDLIISIRDQAPVFDTASYQLGNNTPPLSNNNPGGYGIRLIKSMVDEVKHSISDKGGNELLLIKHNALA